MASVLFWVTYSRLLVDSAGSKEGTMTLDKLIKFWQGMLKVKILLGPTMQLMIEQTVKYLEELREMKNAK